MLNSLLAYLLLGLLLFWPLRQLLRWLGPRTGLFPGTWRYLRPYLPPAQRAGTRAQATAPAPTHCAE